MRSSLGWLIESMDGRYSFFPLIDKQHCKSMTLWLEEVANLSVCRYPKQIGFLDENHGFSQAYANALETCSRGSTRPRRRNSFDKHHDYTNEVKAATIRSRATYLAE